jgi:hypothetical protein
MTSSAARKPQTRLTNFAIAPEHLLFAAALLTLTSLATPLFARNFAVSLETVGSHRLLSAEGNGGGAVNANRTAVGPWETFTLIDINIGELNQGDLVQFKTQSGFFLSIASGTLRADVRNPGDAETFRVCLAGRECADGVLLQGPSRVMLFTKDGQSLLTNHGQDPVTVRTVASGSPGTDEQFMLSLSALTPESLSAPFGDPSLVGPFFDGVDHGPPACSGSGSIFNCRNYRGEGFPHCYRGHEGTDYPLVGGFITQDLGSIDVLAAAPGIVIEVGDGNPDRCYFSPPCSPPPAPSFPPPPPPPFPPCSTTAPATSYVFCPNDPPQAHAANFVRIMQDDGLVASYFHVKRGSVRVLPPSG